jgi:hypothetical protein
VHVELTLPAALRRDLGLGGGERDERDAAVVTVTHALRLARAPPPPSPWPGGGAGPTVWQVDYAAGGALLADGVRVAAQGQHPFLLFLSPRVLVSHPMCWGRREYGRRSGPGAAFSRRRVRPRAGGVNVCVCGAGQSSLSGATMSAGLPPRVLLGLNTSDALDAARRAALGAASLFTEAHER